MFLVNGFCRSSALETMNYFRKGTTFTFLLLIGTVDRMLSSLTNTATIYSGGTHHGPINNGSRSQTESPDRAPPCLGHTV
jgi:hypothetical protein